MLFFVIKVIIFNMIININIFLRGWMMRIKKIVSWFINRELKSFLLRDIVVMNF